MALLIPRFILVPEKIVDMRLSSDALAAIVWFIACNKEQVKPDWVKNRFVWGQTVWLRVSKELRDHQILEVRHSRKGTSIHLNSKLITIAS